MELKPGSFKEVTWDDVRLDVKRLAPDIFTVIEDMSPDSSYKLYEATYPYGAQVVDDDGIFNIYQDDKLVPLNSNQVDKQIERQLDYRLRGMPMSLVLDGQIQLISARNDLIECPHDVYAPGNIMAIYAALDYPCQYQATYHWRMFSGIKNCYMLANLANRKNLQRVEKHFDLKLDSPETLSQQWEFFKLLANQPEFKSNWQSKILLFGKKWLETLNTNDKLSLALFKRAWNSKAIERNMIFTFNNMWEDFIPTIRNKKVDRYILNISNHILTASIGDCLSYRIAGSDDQAGPFTEIAKTLCDIYGLNKYAPIVMVPHKFTAKPHKHTYVPVQLPTANILRKYASKSNFLLADFREIHYVINKFVNTIETKDIAKTPVYNVQNYDYNFYSGDHRSSTRFLPAKEIFDNDNDVNTWLNSGNNQINVRNPFLLACVKISMK
tara:strand:- start:3433 stop:4749 length:1317 start_codon:yes stop_codon:yes gene_type:complete